MLSKFVIIFSSPKVRNRKLETLVKFTKDIMTRKKPSAFWASFLSSAKPLERELSGVVKLDPQPVVVNLTKSLTSVPHNPGRQDSTKTTRMPSK